jgi:hypothetical protein
MRAIAALAALFCVGVSAGQIFIPTCDGVVDDYANIQSALNGGKPASLPPGKTCRVVITPQTPDAGLVLPEGAVLDTTGAQLRIVSWQRPYIQHNILGGAGEGGQYYGIYVDPVVTDAFVFSNFVKAIKSGGVGIFKGITAQIAWNFFDASIPVGRQVN